MSNEKVTRLRSLAAMADELHGKVYAEYDSGKYDEHVENSIEEAFRKLEDAGFALRMAASAI